MQKHFWDNVLDAGIKQIDKCAGEEFITEFGESPFSHQIQLNFCPWFWHSYHFSLNSVIFLATNMVIGHQKEYYATPIQTKCPVTNLGEWQKNHRIRYRKKTSKVIIILREHEKQAKHFPFFDDQRNQFSSNVFKSVLLWGLSGARITRCTAGTLSHPQIPGSHRVTNMEAICAVGCTGHQKTRRI